MDPKNPRLDRFLQNMQECRRKVLCNINLPLDSQIVMAGAGLGCKATLGVTDGESYHSIYGPQPNVAAYLEEIEPKRSAQMYIRLSHRVALFPW